MNPDGFERAYPKEKCNTTSGRENRRAIDLNRNFPDLLNNIITEQNKRTEPETKAVLEWMKLSKFVLSANLHGGYLVANYPFENKKNKGNFFNTFLNF